MKTSYLLLFTVLLTSMSVPATESKDIELSLSAEQPKQVPLNAEIGKRSKENRKMNRQQQVEAAMSSLAEQLEIPIDDILVVSSDTVTWRSGALGCPADGRMYTQALVPGNRIILSVQGVQYSFHAATQRAPFLCPAERAEEPANGSSDRF